MMHRVVALSHGPFFPVVWGGAYCTGPRTPLYRPHYGPPPLEMISLLLEEDILSMFNIGKFAPYD